ncbi:MAG: CopG family transcriptional regulator [Candidatus Zambryskibacteria bacterium]|nr:CopG family transcriptional regulator [Candidatus Zambryskibacteria bacterium]
MSRRTSGLLSQNLNAKKLILGDVMGVNNKHSLVLIYMDKKLKEKVQELARAEETSESEIGRRALSAYLDNEHANKIVNPLKLFETKILRELRDLKKTIQQHQTSLGGKA